MPNATTVSWKKAIVKMSMKPGKRVKELDMPGWISDQVPGLAVTPFLSAALTPQRDEWIVTHISSGFNLFGIVLSSLDHAKRFAATIADVADWTMSAQQLRALPAEKIAVIEHTVRRVAAEIEPEDFDDDD